MCFRMGSICLTRILIFVADALIFLCLQSAVNWLQDEEAGRGSSNCSIYSRTTLSIPTGAS